MSQTGEEALKALEGQFIAAEDTTQAAPEAQQDAQAAADDLAMLTDLLHAAFAIMAPNWAIQKSEAGMLVETWAAVLDKYYPAWRGGLGCEAAALFALVAVFGPRMGMPRKVAEQEPIAEARTNAVQ